MKKITANSRMLCTIKSVLPHVLSTCLACSSVSALAAPQDLTGVWVNQFGSTLVLQRSTDQTLTGTFSTAVATTKACIGRLFPFTAVINDNALAFSISMADCGSPVVIGITGSLLTDDNDPRIETLAVIQKRGEKAWNYRTISTDVYRRTEHHK